MSNNNYYQNPGFSAQLPGVQPPISANQQAQYQGGFQQQAYYPPQSSFGPPQGGLPPPPSTNSFTGPPQYNGAGGSITQPPKSNVQFFSIAGGAPTPSNVLSATPPSIAPPPTFNSNQQIPAGSYVGPPPTSSAGLQPNYGGSAHTANFIAAPPTIGNLYAPGQEYPYKGASSNNLAGMPSEFDSNQEGNVPGGPTLPGIEEMDLSIQCNSQFLRSTTGKLLNSQASSNASRVPLGIVCRPMAGDVGVENTYIDVVDFGNTGIIRCKRCRTYINPFVSFIDNGRQWRYVNAAWIYSQPGIH